MEKGHGKKKIDRCPLCLGEKLHFKNIFMAFDYQIKEVNLLITVNIKLLLKSLKKKLNINKYKLNINML